MQPSLFPTAPPPIARVRMPPELCDVRVFTLHRPWPWAMHGWVGHDGNSYLLHPGPKDIENRDWHPPAALVGQCFIALHAGQEHDTSGDAFLRERGWTYTGPQPDGVITGVGFLSRSFGICEHGPCPRCTDPANDPRGKDQFYMGRVGWILTGRVPLIDPVECPGGQGLRNPPATVLDKLRVSYRHSLQRLAGQLEDGPRMVT